MKISIECSTYSASETFLYTTCQAGGFSEESVFTDSPSFVHMVKEQLQSSPPSTVGAQTPAQVKGKRKASTSSMTTPTSTVKATFKRPTKAGLANKGGLMVPLETLGLPDECMPQAPCKGKYSYTIWNATGNVSVEVLAKKRAFFIKQVSKEVGQIEGSPLMAWSKFDSIDECWQATKTRTGW